MKMFSAEKLYGSLSEHRAKLYGVAALLVILYHAHCKLCWEPLAAFRYGYIGVDFFLFIGSYCLCHSVQKYSLKQFYIRRFLRIYPLWFIVAIVVTPAVGALCFGDEWNPLKLLYGAFVVFPLWTGRGACDWFTASLLHYYALFPLLWWVARRFGPITLYALVCAVSFIVVAFVPLLWTQECGISKLPVFALGIVVWRALYEGERRALAMALIISAAGLGIAIGRDYMFLKTAMACPFVVAMLCVVLGYIGQWKFFRPLEILGGRSLESYYGGWLQRLFEPLFSASLVGTVIYLAQTLIVTAVWAFVNDHLSPLRDRIQKKLS